MRAPKASPNPLLAALNEGSKTVAKTWPAEMVSGAKNVGAAVARLFGSREFSDAYGQAAKDVGARLANHQVSLQPASGAPGVHTTFKFDGRDVAAHFWVQNHENQKDLVELKFPISTGPGFWTQLPIAERKELLQAVDDAPTPGRKLDALARLPVFFEWQGEPGKVAKAVDAGFASGAAALTKSTGIENPRVRIDEQKVGGEIERSIVLFGTVPGLGAQLEKLSRGFEPPSRKAKVTLQPSEGGARIPQPPDSEIFGRTNRKSRGGNI